MNLAQFPRRRYTAGWTPLEKLENLTRLLGGPNIYIKRDDLLGLAAGGNKTRKLEFLMADALAQGADTVITCGAVQSNHCRLTLAAAVKEGLHCQLVLEQRVPNSYRRHASGNNFLYDLLGVEAVHVVEGGSDVNGKMEEVAADLVKQGRKPYIIPGGGSNPIGALGYVSCAQETLAQLLREQNYRVDVVYNGGDGLAYAESGQYDVIVLDIMMPKMDGLEAVRRMRERGTDTPVLFLTARDAIEDRVGGLNAGADDYLVKPFAYEELLARIHVLARRQKATGNLFTLEDLTLDASRHVATRGGTELHLTSREYAILEYLIRNAGVVLSRDRILENAWSMDYEGASNMVDVYIRSLRKKVDDPFEKKLIHTVRGVGYVLRAQE